ncbi:MAG: LamG-like jellyroll fold domain-containing protein [Thermodesulfobacteriota bacterium]
MMKTMARLISGVGFLFFCVPLICSADLYFPHVSTKSLWQTEIAVINTGDQTVTGTLNGYSDAGLILDTIVISLPPLGRRQITVETEFADSDNIGYIIFDTDGTGLQGYTKFYQNGKFRTAIPAVTEINTGDIYIPHIASNDTFWTGISLLNTNDAPINVRFSFNDGAMNYHTTLAAGQHKVISSSTLFGGQERPDMKSGVITGAAGVIGVELFGNDTQLDGLLLTDDTAATIYYPHVADMTKWWTGIVAYNPSDTACDITITPYSETGTALAPSILNIGGKEKYVGVVKNLDLPAQTAWFRIDATQPLSGFELFGTLDGKVLAAYAEQNGGGSKQGVFAKIEQSGWTGIAFVNTEDDAASVTLTAYNNTGSVVATDTITVNGHAKVVDRPENIFSPQSIASATFITYVSDKDVVGFQLNGSSDGKMLDGLPALAGESLDNGGGDDDGNGDDPLIGEWRLTRMEDNEGFGCSVSCPGSTTCVGFDVTCGEETSRFNTDGSVVYTSDGESVSGTYTVSGNEITGCLAGEGCETVQYSISDDTLILEEEDLSGFKVKTYWERISSDDGSGGSGPSGNVLLLESNNSYAQAGTTIFPASGTPADFTVEAWIYPTAGQRSYILSDDAYDFFVDYNAAYSNNGLGIGFYVWGESGSGWDGQTVFESVALNQWNHVAGMFDASTNQITLSINGVLYPPSDFSYSGFYTSSSQKFAVGLNSYDFTGPFSGRIDEVRVSDSVRYTADFSPPAGNFTTDADTVGLWHFDEAAGATSFGDDSGNIHSLTGLNGAHTGADTN